ncbi:DUF3261 domain-containing protein [Thalassotalea sp. 1_MG-2023]|uniref:DUF3261 domain-containing protein n=1 Tax=Thalassotalea sp. 1_MG-2023 TaxID=3062680 RepID=UPI0026E49222|nr:DUF3261 domain-containing protein [Thalassotalea sp. 1_MG-2023]MDO6426644.1 DUF3261 domain-containing protein [Thalassotalea sp. 1_MG-2023]
MQRYIAIIFSILLLSCSAIQQTTKVSIAKGVVLNLLPNEVGVKYYEQALLTVIQQNQQYNMLVNTQYSQGKLAIVAVSLQGMPLFELTRDVVGNVNIKRYIPLDIDPAHMLADMQLIQLPADKLSLQLSGGRLIENQNAINKHRTIYFHQQPVIEITYLENVTEFHHLQRQYKMTIKKIKAD